MQFRARRGRSRSSEINLTPLIDVVFILLIFFLITTTFVQNPGIEVELPKASDASDQTQSDNVIVALTKNGRLIHNGRAVSLQELESELRKHHKERSSAMVIVQADTDTPHGKVVEVMDLARVVGFSQLAIATESEN